MRLGVGQGLLGSGKGVIESLYRRFGVWIFFNLFGLFDRLFQFCLVKLGLLLKGGDGVGQNLGSGVKLVLRLGFIQRLLCSGQGVIQSLHSLFGVLVLLHGLGLLDGGFERGLVRGGDHGAGGGLEG